MDAQMQEQVMEAANHVRAKLGAALGEHPVALVLGSGLGEVAAHLEGAATCPYAQIPHMQASTAPGHAGQFAAGTLAGRSVICMQGRLHLYEGYTAQQVAFPIYVLAALGVQTIILTNAAGGIAPHPVGTLMLIADHINFQGTNPCIGGPNFFDMTHVYAPDLRKRAHAAAEEVGLALPEGTYIGVTGPSFETPAEIRAFAALGAHAVGMSTVQEAIAARHANLQVAGISLISNPAAGTTDALLSAEDINVAAEQGAVNLHKLLEALLPAL